MRRPHIAASVIALFCHFHYLLSFMPLVASY